MTDTTHTHQPEQSLLRRLLADMDACRARTDNRAPETRETALRDMEACLATMAPLAEADVFALMGRLKDQALAPATRDRIADNLGRAAPFMATRGQRVQQWIATREGSIQNSRIQQKEAERHLNKAVSLLHVAQAAVGGWLGSANIAELAFGLDEVLGSIIGELATATAIMGAADRMLDEPLPLVKQILEQDEAEARLFMEAQVATVQ